MKCPSFLDKLPSKVLFSPEFAKSDFEYRLGCSTPLDMFQWLANKDSLERCHRKPNGTYEEFSYIRFHTSDFLRLMRGAIGKRTRSFIDIGCGAGDKLALIKQKWPHITVHGVEHDPAMAAWANALSDADKVFCADAFTIDYSVYDVIYAYWPIAEPVIMNKLVKRVLDTKKAKAKFVLTGFDTYIDKKYRSDIWHPRQVDYAQRQRSASSSKRRRSHLAVH